MVKATAIDPEVVGADNVYRQRGRARVFTSEHDAIQAIKGQTQPPIQPGDVLVYIGGGPLGTGMEETYQLTSALKYLPWGKHVPLLTDARFSGVSTGACVGHIGPEALAGGPMGRLRDGDLIEIVIDREQPGRAGQPGWRPQEARPLHRRKPRNCCSERAPAPGPAPARPTCPTIPACGRRCKSVSGGTWARLGL